MMRNTFYANAPNTQNTKSAFHVLEVALNLFEFCVKCSFIHRVSTECIGDG